MATEVGDGVGVDECGAGGGEEGEGDGEVCGEVF